MHKQLAPSLKVIMITSRLPEACHCHIFHVSNIISHDLSTDELLFAAAVKEKKTRTYHVMVRRNKHSTIRYQDDRMAAM